METNDGYYLVRKGAVPEVLRKVVEVNKMLASGRVKTVHEAAEEVGISRSAYYKYAKDISEFHDSTAGTTVSIYAEIDDVPGILSSMLGVVANKGANILTIHQSIPLNGVASLSLSIQIPRDTRNVDALLRELEVISGVRRIRITGRE